MQDVRKANAAESTTNIDDVYQQAVDLIDIETPGWDERFKQVIRAAAPLGSLGRKKVLHTLTERIISKMNDVGVEQQLDENQMRRNRQQLLYILCDMLSEPPTLLNFSWENLRQCGLGLSVMIVFKLLLNFMTNFYENYTLSE